MKNKISVTEYCRIRNISRQHVLSYLGANRSLEGVRGSNKIGNIWVLTMTKKWLEKNTPQAGSGF